MDAHDPQAALIGGASLDADGNISYFYHKTMHVVQGNVDWPSRHACLWCKDRLLVVAQEVVNGTTGR